MAETSRRGLLVAIGGALLALVYSNDEDTALAPVTSGDSVGGFGVAFGESFGGAT